MIENLEQSSNEQKDVRCQIDGCNSTNNPQISKETTLLCIDCKKFICKLCCATHDPDHTTIENSDNIGLQQNIIKEITKNPLNMGNISPILQTTNFNQSNDSKMISEDTLADSEEKKIQERDPKKPVLNELKYFENDEDSDESDSEKENFDMILSNLKNNNKGHQQTVEGQSENIIRPNFNDIINENDSSDNDQSEYNESENDDNDFINMMTTVGKTPKTPSVITMEDTNNAYSKSSFDSKAIYVNDVKSNNYSNSNFQKPYFPSTNGSNFLQVPKPNDFSNVKQTINESSFQNKIILNGNTNHFNIPIYENQASLFANQHSLTEVQKLLLSKVEYKHLLGQFYHDNLPPKNKVSKKAAKVLGKKKRKAKDELGGFENDESMIVEDDPIPELEGNMKENIQNNYDTKSLSELKNRSKKILDQIKADSEILFKDIKPHIHSQQYQRDEQDRINKYKKYAIEGIESYFLYLKDQFQIEYDKLKKCKRREKLSKMMNRILESIDKYQHFKEPKDFINFMNKDYKTFFNQIKTQLYEVQKEGNDFPPHFQIVYENLYDIFASLLSYISLNLPNQKKYSQFTQPIISMYNSKCFLIPCHYPSKKVIGIYDCRTTEIEEIQYDCSQIQEFQKYRNYSLVNDNDFIYFIGGSSYIEEKNTYNPTSKCFKMSRHSGEISAIRDMPFAKMKFGIALMNNSIYTFGGLQTAEKHRTNSCEKYDINTNTWKILPVMQKNRVCPIVSSFIGENSNQKQQIYIFGGMEDKNNISNSIEVFDQKLDIWIDFIDKPANSRCYIPKQLGYAIQINFEQILIIGGLSGRKQKPCCSMQIYNISKKSICNLSLDSLPTGIMKDHYSGQPVIYNKSIMLLNTQVSQYFPILKQLEGVSNIVKIGLNQQEIIATHCY